MYRRALIRLSVACVTVMASFILVSVAVAAQPTQQPPPSSPTQVLIYDPYPLGILPADLESEIERVRREVQGIFNQALLQSRTLPPPNLTGQPPTLQGTGYQAVQMLGKIMNFDEKALIAGEAS